MCFVGAPEIALETINENAFPISLVVLMSECYPLEGGKKTNRHCARAKFGAKFLIIFLLSY